MLVLSPLTFGFIREIRDGSIAVEGSDSCVRYGVRELARALAPPQLAAESGKQASRKKG